MKHPSETILKPWTLVVAFAALAILALSACDTTMTGAGVGSTGDAGILELSITDAPLMADGVNGVFITVEDILYNNAEDEWVSMEGFDGPQTFDLLALNNGNSRLLGELELPAGEYEQIRFMLGVQERGNQGPPVSPGSWVEFGDNDTFDEETDEPLFVPSGGQTGYKATAEEPFTIAPGGIVEMTADFDLRRAVVKAGPRYLLKPVLRLIVNDEVGSIVGEVSNEDPSFSYVAYAYGSGAFNSGEDDDPEEGESRFPNAVVSAEIVDNPDGPDYVLPYLPAGAYTVVVAEYDGEEYLRSAAIGLGAEVTAGETTEVDLDLNDL